MLNFYFDYKKYSLEPGVAEILVVSVCQLRLLKLELRVLVPPSGEVELGGLLVFWVHMFERLFGSRPSPLLRLFYDFP